jgi:hypothetical protein
LQWYGTRQGITLHVLDDLLVVVAITFHIFFLFFSKKAVGFTNKKKAPPVGGAEKGKLVKHGIDSLSENGGILLGC